MFKKIIIGLFAFSVQVQAQTLQNAPQKSTTEYKLATSGIVTKDNIEKNTTSGVRANFKVSGNHARNGMAASTISIGKEKDPRNSNSMITVGSISGYLTFSKNESAKIKAVVGVDAIDATRNVRRYAAPFVGAEYKNTDKTDVSLTATPVGGLHDRGVSIPGAEYAPRPNYIYHGIKLNAEQEILNKNSLRLALIGSSDFGIFHAKHRLGDYYEPFYELSTNAGTYSKLSCGMNASIGENLFVKIEGIAETMNYEGKTTSWDNKDVAYNNAGYPTGNPGQSTTFKRKARDLSGVVTVGVKFQ